MNSIPITADVLPDTARVWVYQSGRNLSPEESREMTELGQAFVSQWASHGNKLAASFEVRHERFVVLVVDESAAGASGCSIDTSVHFIQELEQHFGTTFFDRMTLCYMDNGEVEDCRMTEISELINAGILTKDTVIFDNTIQNKGDLGTRWQVRLEESWAGRYL